jgi:hypothetical protein
MLDQNFAKIGHRALPATAAAYVSIDGARASNAVATLAASGRTARLANIAAAYTRRAKLRRQLDA